MKLLLQGHEERYALEQLQLSLFPLAPMEYTHEPFSHCDGAVSSLSQGKVWLTATTVITLGPKKARASRRLKLENATVSNRRRLLQQSYYQAAIQLLPSPPAWGALAGVRPTKLSTRHLLAGGTVQSCDRMLETQYFISPQRRQLCIDASVATLEALKQTGPRDLSLYVGIPFCPTRCSYCSFVSQAITKFSHLVGPYLQALLKEIAYTAPLVADAGYRIRTIYIGGGTPTTLTTVQMGQLMDALAAHFDLSHVIEYTVEGGRPDTLDKEKLTLIREKGCNRMSINPQTMNDSVLAEIGRCHTTRQTVSAYQMARDVGFTGINMDLIAGLPSDSVASFADSLEQILQLQPDNITVHTLALKRGSDLYGKRVPLPSAQDVGEMLDGTNARLRQAGFLPYYLYRQKYMSGNFENVGWCRPGYAGLYNIYMMEELQTIVSLGAGGMNKINLPGGKLERFHNPKYPKEYLERLDTVLAQKETLFAMLKELG